MAVTSILTFANLKAGTSQSSKNVYFIRCIGHNRSYLTDIQQMDQIMLECEKTGLGGYLRLQNLPMLTQQEDISFYMQVYQQWESSSMKQLVLRTVNDNRIPEQVIQNALSRIYEEFETNQPNASTSIKKNFVMKLLYWTDWILPQLFSTWKAQSTYKVVICSKPKKQEYLFYSYLTMLGIDVLILSPEKELDLDAGLLRLSDKIELQEKSLLQIPEYNKDQVMVQSTVKEPSPEKKNRVVIPPRSSVRGTRTQDRQPQVIPAEHVVQESPRARVYVNQASAQQEKTFEELAQLASSVVMITIYDNREEVIGTGSGIMVGTAGYILTNNHVASGGSFYEVRMEEEEKVYRTNEMIKYHSILDLALLRIDRRLKTLPIYQGHKDLIRGQKVVAIGSPLGLFNSVSNGIISGFRHINDINMIQFTAPISPGSSGGAVLNMFGEVIGISTAHLGNGQNINLAVDYHDITNFVRGFVP